MDQITRRYGASVGWALADRYGMGLLQDHLDRYGCGHLDTLAEAEQRPAEDSQDLYDALILAHLEEGEDMTASLAEIDGRAALEGLSDSRP